MNNPKIEAYCDSIDNTFLDYMTKNCNSNELSTRLAANLTKISSELQSQKPKSFKVILVNGKNDFCGIKIYPDINKLKLIYDKLDKVSLVDFCKSWLILVDDYIVEIDENCFDRHTLNFTNKELTAMLLHELGHIVYSSTIPEVIYNSYMVHRQELKYGRATAVRIAQQFFYTIPTLLACGAHVIRSGIDGRKEEYIADKLFGIDTYKPYLYSAIDKIIRAYGTSLYLNKNDYNKKIDNMIAQNNVNISELATRRRAIKDDLLYQSANTHSKTVRRAYIDVMKHLGIGFADRYTNAIVATESLFEDLDSGKYKLNGILNTIKFVDTDMALSTAIETAFNSKANECCCDCKFAPKMPTDYDIELVALGIEKIHSNIDRMASLDELYKLRENLNNFISYSTNNGSYESNRYKIDKCKKTIDDLIETTKLKEVEVTKMVNFMDYPTDYSK